MGFDMSWCSYCQGPGLEGGRYGGLVGCKEGGD